MKRIVASLIILFFVVGMACAQQVAPPSASQPRGNEQASAFLQAADEVLAEMSKLLSLPILSPLKKSLRSRDEIQEYLLRKMMEDKDPGKRYADQKTMEKFGLLPKDFPLEAILVKVLTEQIAGLYDPESQEFFVADWNNPSDERMVMSHELTHALQDQHFHIDPWTEAAKPNDDAGLARDAVLEGSAVAAMMDYILRGKGSIRDLGDIDPAILLGDVDNKSEMARMPMVLQDELLFPYVSGATFTQKVLKATDGWPDFHMVFENPPVSTQQIMHPDLYLKHVEPPQLSLPGMENLLPSEWKKLDENNMGEFGTLEVMKKFLNKTRATALAATWAADRYAIFENQKNKNLVLLFRIRLSSDEDAARFFGAYSEVLELKYPSRSNLMRRPNFFSFSTPEDGVFLRCLATDCLVLEGSNRDTYDRLTRQLGWPAGPAVPVKPGEPNVRKAAFSAPLDMDPSFLHNALNTPPAFSEPISYPR